MTPQWMKDYDVSVVELLFCVTVGAGLIAAILAPHRVAAVVQLTPWATTHAAPALLVALAAICVAVFRWVWIWGPVRTDTATLRWRLSGPDSRRPELLHGLMRLGTAVVATTAAVSAVLATLAPSFAPLLLCAGVVAGVVVVIGAYLRQTTADAAIGATPPKRRQWRSPETLHRTMIDPKDGYARSVGLAVSMMDCDWIARARVVRWQRTHTSRTRRNLPQSSTAVLVLLDLRRLASHPDAVLRALSATAVIVVAPWLLTVHMGTHLVIATLALCAGNSTALGLRSVTDDPGIGRLLAWGNRRLRLVHAAVPTGTVILYSVAAVSSWSLNPVQACVLIVGASVAVYRRASRTDLPFDSPAVIDSLLTGAVIQPQVVAMQCRGLVATAVTAGVMGLV